MAVEKDQVVALKDAEAIRAEVDAKYLGARQAYELANMSPDIRPEHYALCITQTFVGIRRDDDGTYLADVHPVEPATKPVGAVRVVLTEQPDGTIAKTVKPSQPVEREVAAVEEAAP